MRLALVGFVLVLPVAWRAALAPILHSGLAKSHSRAGQVVASVGYDVCVWLGALAVVGSLPKAALPSHPVGTIASLAMGSSTGAVLYIVLAGVRARLVPSGLRLRRRVVVHASVFFLTTWAEEVIWRGFLLSSLVSYGVPPSLALVVSTFLFACMHHGSMGWDRVPCHVVTGFAFGGVYLAAGNLVAPIAAHLVYNLGVVGEHETRRLTPAGEGR